MTFFEIAPLIVAGWLGGLLMFIGFALLVAWREAADERPPKRELLDLSYREPLYGITPYDREKDQAA